MVKRKAFSGWHQHAAHSCELRRRLKSFLYMWVSSKLGTAFMTWRQYARWGW